MGMHQNMEDPGREYSRANVYIPFEYRIVPREERDRVQARISCHQTMGEDGRLPSGGSGDPLLDEWLKILNSKLDTIIRLMTLQQDGIFRLACKAVNISGGGMGFYLQEAISPGEILEIKIALAFQRPVVLFIYGEVVKADPKPEGYFIAVHFVHMDDSIRDMIVRFVFEKEREIIREARR